MKSLAGAMLLLLAIGLPSALAAESSAKMGSSDKEAISKSCSEQANAKGLHGKARQKFRRACKRAGGKVE